MFARVFCFLCLAATSQALALQLDAIAERVRTQHPALKAARLAIDEARGRQLAAGRLPNPALETSFQNESRVSPRTTVFSLDQSFPLTRRLSLEKKLSTQLVQAAELEVQDVERRLIAEARTLAVQLLALDQHLMLHRQQMDLARRLSAFARERAKSGEVSPLDAAQAQVDLQRLLLETRRMEAARLGLVGQLKPMLGLGETEPLQLQGDLTHITLPIVRSWRARPDYLLAQTKSEAARTEADLAKAKRWQDVSAGFFAAREQQDVTPRHTERTGFVGFRISIPLPLWNRNQGEVAEKAASAERARLEQEALAAHIRSEAATAHQEMEANAALLRETRDEFLPLVMEQTAKLEKAYAAGQADLLTLLRAHDQRLELESGALDAARDFHLARIRYETATFITPLKP
ncbi:MAG: TolC family protein [Prosthecobacter sp.]|jgi:cobalt-zinc-cadmium efflux system outer membrane protein|nr:TolC family protein [Prosthecobacter sp.]